MVFAEISFNTKLEVIYNESDGLSTENTLCCSNGWLNDPNGLVYFEGSITYSINTILVTLYMVRCIGGHAVSRNLLHWEHLPIALYPDEHGVIFSGSSVVDWHDTTGFLMARMGW